MLPPPSAQPGAMSCIVCGLDADPRAPAFLIECHFCGRWLHGNCAQINEQDALLVAKFACVDCQQHGHEGVKYEPNNTTFVANAMNFSPLPVHLGGYATSSTPVQLRHKKSSSGFRRLLGAAVYARSGVHLVPFHDVQPSFLQRHALEEPVLIAGNSHRAAGLEEAFPVLDAATVAELLTGDREVRTIDVTTQTRDQLTASAWLAKTTNSNKQNKEDTTLLANAEFQLQQTPMQLKVAAPIAVSQVNWNCLMESNNGEENLRNTANGNVFGTFLEANAFLDFTLAPGGQCTWLSVSGGELWVYLIPPTSAAFDAYRAWKCDPDFATAFLAERVEKCIKCVVSAGSTLLVPAGWTFARYAGGAQSCSLFHGFFACTSAIEGQLGVVLLEMQHDALAEYWRETSSGWLTVDANVQLWTAVCYYVRQLLMGNNGMTAQVSDLDRRALQRAFPRLREWSALPASLKSVNGITWTPSSQREAQAIVGRLEQAIAATCLPTHNLDDLQPTSGLGNDSKLPPISPNEATYIYSAASVPDGVSSPWGSTSTGFDSTSTNNFSSSTPMWSNYDPMQQHQQHQPDHLVISTQNQPYPNSDPSFQQHSPNQNLPEYGAEYGYLSGGMSEGFMATSNQHNLGLEGLGTLGGVASHPLNSSMTPSVEATGFQQPRLDSNGNYVDMLMRHRASCHRCGNLRKKNIRCPVCPHIFCAKCAEKMIDEHGERIFENGCPVCKELCCCGKNRTTNCTRKFHCYKKCPSTKRPASG
ncbi:Lysine-specific demethylase 7B [Phytophthora citrophthora]|uniref:Lysine-specific demethylase 7B n=1 Tax=Phytophthora citrophthora TaxID=4793 RepID=A0AAD9GLG1_9STRA|nr:Lysine-specific demethylase 7B [Phytophthora citrophthora]